MSLGVCSRLTLQPDGSFLDRFAGGELTTLPSTVPGLDAGACARSSRVTSVTGGRMDASLMTSPLGTTLAEAQGEQKPVRVTSQSSWFLELTCFGVHCQR